MHAPDPESLSARDLHVWRGNRHVLRGLTLEVAPGEVVHVTGPNGSGKTTLLRVLAGLLDVEQGEILWRGQALARVRDEFAASFSFLGHENGLKADLTASENLAFAIGLRRPVAAPEIESALAQAGIARCSDLPARVLSAGQRRRLAFARVLLSETQLWILDEPFTNLDAEGIELVTGLISAQAGQGGMVLVAAHQVLQLPDRGARRVQLQ